MDIHTIRMELRTKSIYDLPLRVTYYARVSSESDEQLNSLGNQVSYYEDLIRRNLPWTFVPGYIDEGLSGISTKKRENFNRMIEDAAEGQFDLIITKEISRFARNTLDSIQYTRQLLSYGVGVCFLSSALIIHHPLSNKLDSAQKIQHFSLFFQISAKPTILSFIISHISV